MKKIKLLIALVAISSGLNAQNIDLNNSTDYIRIQKNGESDFSRAFGINSSNHMYIGSVEKTIGNIYFYNNGMGHLMTIQPNGNVGIGTTNPVSKLDIRTTTNKEIRLNFNNESAVTFVPNNGNSIFHLSHGHDNRLHISQGGTVGAGKLMTFVNTGNIGIGTTNPESKLEVRTTTNKRIRLNFNNESAITFVPNNGNSIFHLSHGHDNRLHISQGGTVGAGKLMTFVNSGNVGIGTSNPDMKLTVKGNIHAEEVKIDLSVPAPDYVFKEDYNLRTIDEVEKFILENSHLPEIPSAKDFEQNGVMQAEMDMSLLKKIEELTLYTIAQEKKINTQNSKTEKLEKEIEKLKSLVTKLLESKK